jgi:hypothetical protein
MHAADRRRRRAIVKGARRMHAGFSLGQEYFSLHARMQMLRDSKKDLSFAQVQVFFCLLSHKLYELFIANTAEKKTVSKKLMYQKIFYWDHATLVCASKTNRTSNFISFLLLC